jgi:hypothetical protein
MKPVPILVRIAITPEEWRAVRTVALQRKQREINEARQKRVAS